MNDALYFLINERESYAVYRGIKIKKQIVFFVYTHYNWTFFDRYYRCYQYKFYEKKNLDALYFGSLVPVTELNEMLQTYHKGLASSLYKAKRGEASSSQTSNELEHSLNKIN